MVVLIAGYFTDKQLTEILNEIALTSAISLHNLLEKSSIKASYSYPNWVVHEENKNNIVFQSTELLVMYIQSVLKNALVIKYVSSANSVGNDNNCHAVVISKAYQKHLQEDAAGLMRDDGLLYLIQVDEVLPLLLKNLVNDQNGADNLALALIRLIQVQVAAIFMPGFQNHILEMIAIASKSKNYFPSLVRQFLEGKSSPLALLSIGAKNEVFSQIANSLEPYCKKDLLVKLKSIKQLADEHHKVNQMHIIKKLAKFLEVSYGLETAELQVFLKGSKGLCFGLAVCHAAMDVTGYLDWWEAALSKILNWDDQIASLHEKISLPGARPNQSQVSLKSIFKRVLNYIVSAQADYYTSYSKVMPRDVDQAKFLDKKNYFSVIDKQEKIRKVQNSKKMAGYFSAELFSKLLNSGAIQDTIFIIMSGAHAVRIGYRDNAWIFYDPSGNHNRSIMHESFDTKEKLINAVFKCLGQSLKISVASLDKNKIIHFPAYEQAIKNPVSAVELLKENGLTFMAQHTPDALAMILKKIKNTPSAFDIIADAVAHEFIAFNANNDVEMHNGLYAVLRHTYHLLPLILDIISKSQRGADCLASALSNAVSFKELLSSWHLSEHVVEKMMNTLALSVQAPDALAKMLESKKAESWYRLPALDKFLSIIAKSKHAPDNLVKALARPGLYNCFWWMVCSKTFSQVVDIIEKSSEAMQQFREKLLFKPQYMVFTGLDCLCIMQPKELQRVLAPDELEQYIVKFLQRGGEIINYMESNAKMNLATLFEMMITIFNKNKNAAKIFCMSQHFDQLVCLMAQYADVNLVNVFAYLTDFKHDLKTVLTRRTVYGGSILYNVAYYSPESLQYLSDRAVLVEFAENCINKRINLFLELEKNNPLKLRILCRVLSEYLKTNMVLDLQAHIVNLSQHHKNSFWTVDIPTQASAASKMILSLRGGTAELTDEEIVSLNTGALGDIVAKYKRTEIIPPEFKAAEDSKTLRDFRFFY